MLPNNVRSTIGMSVTYWFVSHDFEPGTFIIIIFQKISKKIFLNQISLRLKILKQWKFIDYNALLSTVILTGVQIPYTALTSNQNQRVHNQI